jgi:hypothetical protein
MTNLRVQVGMQEDLEVEIGIKRDLLNKILDNQILTEVIRSKEAFKITMAIRVALGTTTIEINQENTHKNSIKVIKGIREGQGLGQGVDPTDDFIISISN